MKDEERLYNCPISVQLDGFRIATERMMTDNVVKAVQNMQININENDLLEALNADKRRYEEAYKRGYEACRKKYETVLEEILVSIKPYIREEKGGNDDG